MLKITKTVMSSEKAKQGCGKTDDYNCGVRAKMG